MRTSVRPVSTEFSEAAGNKSICARSGMLARWQGVACEPVVRPANCFGALFPVVERFTSQEPPDSNNTPITEMVVNSMITNLEDGAEVKAGQPVDLQGIAWDGGYVIVEVAVSIDDGSSWTSTQLGEDLGRFSWRQWTHRLTAQQAGTVTVMVRARNKIGQTQVEALLFNGAGYHNNIVQTLGLKFV
ncbi:hypothetical protein [Ensifer sp. 4252]|uniref:hypothetical protein n=1 Tax=Ensifer sp. 4252 TaxID=3373915 RepID=UPI003D1FF2C1